ncbi:bifunctional glycosyltransferase family 2/GtrA family protein [Leuconostoc rapi]|uniref:bifunctional glycosyltransferase family 2/GtrA family protein n=1 Tax=Leuconostoc rapi TaxID=1406906 RepID=UPI0019573998|nr:bifunctional glycosyltransferase family 2/GtrA family protein [Leuconostoc rapi]MBM7435308.1 putative flippase GtrA [Leuconostoc rapi]
MTCIPIVIPSLNPDEELIALINRLMIHTGKIEQPIILVNDGSAKKYDSIFSKIQTRYQVTILQHDVNLGKGRAIKTAINYIIKHIPTAAGMITIDSDGQHTVDDMMTCTDNFLKKPKNLILGTRIFDNNVPFRSKFGNILTAKCTQMTIGVKVSDTQTGLRVIPKQYFDILLGMTGERFEFEMNMILEAPTYGIEITEVPIKTIYIADNQSSHFRIIHDSISIYALFIKYIFGAISSFLIDIFVFAMMVAFLSNISARAVFIAAILSRLVSSTANYYINKSIVFKNNNHLSFLSYFLLVLMQLIVSTLLVITLQHETGINVVMIKVVVDSLLFIVSYQIQKHVVFKRG